MKVILREEALRDVRQACEWYGARRPGLELEFRAALDATIVRILCFPLAFEPRERGLRRALVSRFPHSLYFRIYPEALVVVGVLHAQPLPG